MLVGIYYNIPFFDTLETAHVTEIGMKKNGEVLTFKAVEEKRKHVSDLQDVLAADADRDFKSHIPKEIQEFKENYDFLVMYDNWKNNKTQLRCFSIFDSIIVLPTGDVPICQNLDVKLGNIHQSSLDEIINSDNTIKTQNWHSKNCNLCWINYHRKYDVVLYKSFENFFGRWATTKLFGYYQWDEQNTTTYNDLFKS